jgi:hypothetical protein
MMEILCNGILLLIVELMNEKMYIHPFTLVLTYKHRIGPGVADARISFHNENQQMNGIFIKILTAMATK